MKTTIKKLSIILLSLCTILLIGCNSSQNVQEEVNKENTLNENEYINEIGSDISLLIKSTMAGEINLDVAKESCQNIINVNGTIKDEKLKEYQESINEKANLIKSKCEYVLKNIESDEVNGIETLVTDLSKTVLSMIEQFNISKDNKGVIACLEELNSIIQIEIATEQEKTTEKEEPQKKEEVQKIPNILGRYEYNQYNNHGVIMDAEAITITGTGDEMWTFTCDSYYLQHAYSQDGEIVAREDVTNDLVEQGNSLGKGSMMNGYIGYAGDNVWKGYIGYEEYDPTMSCKIVKNGNSITLTYEGQSITYKK